MKDAKDGRRRGAALEDAILDAAWQELTERGYSSLTLEAVAKRAGTSRPVLHRRWANRTELAAAAMARFVAANPVTVPDLGAVRDELILLLRQLSDRGAPVLIRLMLEMSEDLAKARLSFSWLRSQVAKRDVIDNILKRGVERGEIDPARITPDRIIADGLGAPRDHDDARPDSRRGHRRDRGRYFPSAGFSGTERSQAHPRGRRSQAMNDCLPAAASVPRHYDPDCRFSDPL